MIDFKFISSLPRYMQPKVIKKLLLVNRLRRAASGRQSSCDAVAIGRPRFNFTSLNRLACCDPGGVALTEADHFGNCPVCGAYIGMRDLGQVLAHVHDAEIEIGEGPEPPMLRGFEIKTKAP
jgi:hypothetical protein